MRSSSDGHTNRCGDLEDAHPAVFDPIVVGNKVQVYEVVGIEDDPVLPHIGRLRAVSPTGSR
jgi:hypothetical protein